MPLNFRLQKRQNIYEQILRIPTNWPPDILSAMYAYYLFVFSILYLYFMGDCNRNMKFGYFKASPKLKKKKYSLSREMPQSYYHSSK